MDEIKMQGEGNNYKFDEKFQVKGKKKKLKFLIVFTAVSVLFLLLSCVVYNAGFIPITEFLSVKKPVGKSTEVDIGSYIEEYPAIGEIPNLNKIKYKIYGTDAPVDTVISDYAEELRKDGYSLKYEGIEDMEKTSFQYYGFLKGLTAVLVIVTSDVGKVLGYKTLVLYATGNALDFKEILEWYQNQG